MPAINEIPDCNTNGVLGVLPGIVGTLQALEAVKILTGTGEILSGRLMLYNGLDQSVQKISFPLNPKNLNISKLRDYYGEPGCPLGGEISAAAFTRLLERSDPPLIIDVRDPGEFETLSLPGSINIPLPELKSRRDVLESHKTAYLICATGKRSRVAQQWIKENYPHLAASSVEGGIQNFRTLCP
jgi:adenylyltransferase/sulfurtransferase